MQAGGVLSRWRGTATQGRRGTRDEILMRMQNRGERDLRGRKRRHNWQIRKPVELAVKQRRHRAVVVLRPRVDMQPVVQCRTCRHRQQGHGTHDQRNYQNPVDR